MPGGFIQYNAPDLMTAVALASEFKLNDHYKYFRGQRDSSWQVASSLARANEADRAKAIVDFDAFYSFARNASQLVPYLQNDDALIATSQHHGLALTNFIDFTHSPKVAGWFASDGASINCEGAIFLVDSDAEEAFRTFGGRVRFIHVDVPNLWRLQAQEGLFLEAPQSIDHVWPLDRIVFPHIASHFPIQRSHIYPDKKSALELAIDQYQLMRRQRAAFKDILEKIHVHGDVMIEMIDDYSFNEKDTFSVPVDWILGPNEQWKDIDVDSDGPTWDDFFLNSVASLTEIIEKRRTCTKLFTVVPGSDGELQNLIDRVWDGMRPYPYSAAQISRCIVASIKLQRELLLVELNDWRERHRISEVLFGSTIEIEMAISGASSTRAYVEVKRLWQALKQSVREKLDTDIHTPEYFMIKLLNDDWMRPGSKFDEQHLIELFVDQIIPWQIVTKRDPVAFSPFHIITLGRP